MHGVIANFVHLDRKHQYGQDVADQGEQHPWQGLDAWSCGVGELGYFCWTVWEGGLMSGILDLSRGILLLIAILHWL